jgi:hypothetical protein
MSIESLNYRGPTLTTRRSEYDVSDKINTTDPTAVESEVRRIFLGLYPAASPALRELLPTAPACTLANGPAITLATRAITTCSTCWK